MTTIERWLSYSGWGVIFISVTQTTKVKRIFNINRKYGVVVNMY